MNFIKEFKEAETPLDSFVTLKIDKYAKGENT